MKTHIYGNNNHHRKKGGTISNDKAKIPICKLSQKRHGLAILLDVEHERYWFFDMAFVDLKGLATFLM